MASSNRYTAGQDSVCTACKITFFFFFFPSDDGLCGPIVVETCYLDLQQGPSSPDVNFNTFFFSFSFFLLGRRRRRRMTWVNINSAPLHRLVRSLEIDTSRVVFFFRRVAAVVDTRPRWKKKKEKEDRCQSATRLFLSLLIQPDRNSNIFRLRPKILRFQNTCKWISIHGDLYLYGKSIKFNLTGFHIIRLLLPGDRLLDRKRGAIFH